MTKELVNLVAKLKELKAENTKLKKEVEGANLTACNFQDLAIKHEWEKNEAVRLKKKYYKENKALKKLVKTLKKISNVRTDLTRDALLRNDELIEETKTLKEERTYRNIALAVSITFNLVIGFAALAFIIDKYI